MRRLGQERGFTLLEVLIALGILGFIGVAFLNALATSTRATITLDAHVKAEELARRQLEEIKGLAYLSTYPTPTPGGLPGGYTVSITTQDITSTVTLPLGLCTAEYLTPGPNSCNTIQKVTVTVNQDDKPVFSMTTYKKK